MTAAHTARRYAEARQRARLALGLIVRAAPESPAAAAMAAAYLAEHGDLGAALAEALSSGVQ